VSKERRLFSKSERIAVEIVTGRTGEGDHIKPYSKGGKTSVENCQLVSATINKKKGTFNFVPRKWQAEFFKQWEDRKPHQPFMLIAIPGGGKTMAALEVCRRWMRAGSDRRIIIVVPTDNLRVQWKDEATKFGIPLQTKEFGTDFKDGFQGGVATYHLVANNSALFNAICSVAPTMVVFDEIHHCGDEAHFGRGIVDAFQLSKERLLMSGTPWKTDGKAIPFVKYDGNGYAVGDFSYDYPRALNEDVVRYIVFDHAKGIIKNDFTGKTESLSQEITDDEAQKRLKRILDPSGDYVRDQILFAHRKLMDVRKSIPDAAALAACVDQDHAVKVAALIERLTGSKPSVIISDSEFENDNVRQFRNSKKEWLVAVRKVSEGTDIKRLQVLCYLTNTTSELFFRQLIGRVSRVRNMEDYEAYVYLPADPRLIRCARNIENAQVQALIEQSEKDYRELNDRQDGEYEFESYSTIHNATDVAFIGGESVSLEEYKQIQGVAETLSLSMQKVLQVMQMTQDRFVTKPVELDHTQEPSKEDRMDALRRKCNSAAFRLSKLIDLDVKEINNKFIKQFGKQQKDMTEEELQMKLKILIRESNNR
jgi:superfamily II DNA or RNA helicase